MEYESFLSLMNPFEQTEVFSSDMPENPKIEEKEQNISELLETYAVRFLPAGLLNTNEYETAIRQSLARIISTMLHKNNPSLYLANDLLGKFKLKPENPTLVYRPFSFVKYDESNHLNSKIRDLLTGVVYDVSYENKSTMSIFLDIEKFKKNYDKKPVPESIVKLPKLSLEEKAEVWFYPVIRVNASLEGSTDMTFRKSIHPKEEPNLVKTADVLEKYLLELNIKSRYYFYPNSTRIFSASLDKNSVFNLTVQDSKIINVKKDWLGYIKHALIKKKLCIPGTIGGYLGAILFYNAVIPPVLERHSNNPSDALFAISCLLGGIISGNLALVLGYAKYAAAKHIPDLSKELGNKQKTSIPVDFNKWPDNEKCVFIH